MSISINSQSHLKLYQAAQKELSRDLLSDTGWEASGLLDGMNKTDDLYVQANSQVKLISVYEGT